MSGNRGVVYLGPNKVQVSPIDDPKMATPAGRKIDHGVILRVVCRRRPERRLPRYSLLDDGGNELRLIPSTSVYRFTAFMFTSG